MKTNPMMIGSRIDVCMKLKALAKIEIASLSTRRKPVRNSADLESVRLKKIVSLDILSIFAISGVAMDNGRCERGHGCYFRHPAQISQQQDPFLESCPHMRYPVASGQPSARSPVAWTPSPATGCSPTAAAGCCSISRTVGDLQTMQLEVPHMQRFVYPQSFHSHGVEEHGMRTSVYRPQPYHH